MAFSGTEKEAFFGTISPKTTCRNVTRIKATAKLMPVIHPSARPVPAIPNSTKW